jgi:hypothetical protein
MIKTMNKFFKHIVPAALLLVAAGTSSCVNDLDVTPIDPNLVTADSIQAEQLFNKCYACIGVAGSGGANGGSDVDGIDGGTSGYVRQVWNANELTSDFAICGWGDDGISQFCYNTYDASHPMLRGLYYRLFTSIVFCNDYLKSFEDYDATMTAEVRFIRALDYYYLLDGWGNVPLVTAPTGKNPEQATRAEIFQWLEQELLDLREGLSTPRALKKGEVGYGRVDRDAADLLLARLYLNAEVYTGNARWDDAARYAKMVMDGPHKLNTTSVTRTTEDMQWTYTPYQMLFMGDNGITSAATEAVFPVLQDGARTTSWGTSLFLMASTFDANMHEDPFNSQAVNGTVEQWGGNRARPELIRLFFPNDDAPVAPGYEVAMAAGDDRALFNTVGRTLENNDVSVFTNGYAVAKFNNFKTDGSAPHDSQFPDCDFFFMRSAEAYLTYAEALTRMSGDVAPAEAVAALNAIRGRANALQRNRYTLDQILDEWGREFYFEGRRRIDLIRFGKFGGNTDYVWTWKGGTYAGRNFDATRNLFAIPTNDLVVNTNLVQNPGY